MTSYLVITVVLVVIMAAFLATEHDEPVSFNR
jgi:hypothetical protein